MEVKREVGGERRERIEKYLLLMQSRGISPYSSSAGWGGNK